LIMSVYRETPPIIIRWNDTCLFQTPNDSTLRACGTEPYKESIFYRQIGAQWIISTRSVQRCNLATLPTAEVPQIIQNTGRTLAPIVTISELV
jgi:hypothetical protein